MSRIRSLVAASALALGLASVSTAAPAVSGSTWVAASNGLVGTQQTVIVRAPRLAGKVATVTFTNQSVGSNAGQALVNSSGFAFLPWTPNVSGVWSITATGGGASLDSTSIAVAAMPTTTTLLVPGEVQGNAPGSLVVNVEALSGSITPSGTVTVRNQSNAIVATGPVSPTTTPGLATANLTWTAPNSAVTLVASFTPDSSAFTGSSSISQSPAVAGAQAVSLRMPPAMYVGVPQTISAVIQPAFTNATGGSVAFSLNTQGVLSYPMGGSRPIGNGVGSTEWTPSQPGLQIVGVSYSTGDFTISATDTQIVNVLPAPVSDPVNVTTATGTPWAPGVVGSLTAGTSVALVPTSGSGNPVTLAPSGPCVVEGSTVTVLSAGQCTLTASSVGNGGSLKAGQFAYVIDIKAAPKKKRR